MTAHAMSGEREKCIKAGMNDYVAKPVEPDHLFSVLSKWIKIEKQMPEETGNRKSKQPRVTEKSEPTIFDREEFLARMGGNETVCKEILKDMPEYLSGEIKKLKDWLKQKDIYMTTMQAHSIKGMAANIAAHRLRETAYKMELAGKAEDLEKADCFTAELEEEYKRLLSFLYECALLCEETDYVTKVQYVPKPMTADDISAIKPVMSRLNRFLEEGDTRAEDCMGELKECLAGFGFDEYLVRLEKHVFNYDFDEAADTLSAVRRKLSDTSR